MRTHFFRAVLLFCLLLTARFSVAQSAFTIGPKFGLNLKNLEGKGAGGYSIRPDFNAGLAWNFTGAAFVSVGGELLFSGQGAKFRNSNVLVTRTQLNYIAAPILFKYYFWSRTRTTPFLYAGPQVGYLLNAKNSLDGNITNRYKRLDISAALGAGLRMQLEKFWWIVDLRFAPGVVNISPTQPVIRNSVFSANTSFEFGFSKKNARGLR